jgi:hypothetical protein
VPNPFQGPNLAEIDRAAYSNRLMRNDVDRIPQRNAAEDMAIQADQQTMGQNRTDNARRMAADMFSAIADAPDPISTGAMLVQSQAFREIGGELKLPVDQFRPAQGDDPEQIRAAARSWAQAVGAGGGQQRKVHSTHVLDDGTIALTYTDGTTERTSERARNPLQLTDIAGGRALVDRLSGQTQQLSTAEQEAAAAANAAGQQQGAREAATTAALPGQVTAKTRTERLALQVDEGFSASDAMPVINRAIELLGTVKTGGINAAALAASNLLGVTGADEAELSNNLGKAVLSQLRSTFGAAFTEREGARLDSIEANFGKSTEGNLRLLQQLQKMVEREALRGINAAIQMGDQATADQIREGLSFSLTPGQGGMSFATEAEAAAAEQAGRLKKGQRVTVGGQSGVWQ